MGPGKYAFPSPAIMSMQDYHRELTFPLQKSSYIRGTIFVAKNNMALFRSNL
jgi:hypothetical protein